MPQDSQDLDKSSNPFLGVLCSRCKTRDRSIKRPYCNPCYAELTRQYRIDNPERMRSIDLKKAFGITLEQYTVLWDQQGGVCAICKQPESVIDTRTQRPRNLAVDHCHEIGAVRGLLCMACNQGIGNFREDTNSLLSAIKYLTERSNGVIQVGQVTGKVKGKAYKGRQPRPVILDGQDLLG